MPFVIAQSEVTDMSRSFDFSGLVRPWMNMIDFNQLIAQRIRRRFQFLKKDEDLRDAMMEWNSTVRKLQPTVFTKEKLIGLFMQWTLVFIGLIEFNAMDLSHQLIQWSDGKSAQQARESTGWSSSYWHLEIIRMGYIQQKILLDLSIMMSVGLIKRWANKRVNLPASWQTRNRFSNLVKFRLLLEVVDQESY